MAAATTTPQLPDENAGPALLAISGILIALIMITTCLRLFVRFQHRAIGIDDYTIVLVTVLCLMRFAIQVVQVNKFGNGRHRVYLAVDDYINNNMLGWYAQILLFASTCFVKCSICLLLLRIKKERRLKIFLYILMGGLFITNFGCIVILLAQCQPISVYWTGGGGVCWDTRVRIYAIYFTICKFKLRHSMDGPKRPATDKSHSSLLSSYRRHLLSPPPCGGVESPHSAEDEDLGLRPDGLRYRVSSRAALLPRPPNHVQLDSR